jgi:hypothetical protein
MPLGYIAGFTEKISGKMATNHCEVLFAIKILFPLMNSKIALYLTHF